jgi:hypothetical protein
LNESKLTVRVRILVAVDRNGKWISHGASGESEAEARQWIFIEDLEEGEVYHWIEADVPLPVDAGPAIKGMVLHDE